MENFQKFFKSSDARHDDGWQMCHCGCSSQVEEDFVITTEHLHSTDIPEHCMDAKDFSELVAGLLNAFYNGLDISQFEPEEVMKLGVMFKKEVVAGPRNMSNFAQDRGYSMAVQKDLYKIYWICFYRRKESLGVKGRRTQCIVNRLSRVG